MKRALPAAAVVAALAVAVAHSLQRADAQGLPRHRHVDRRPATSSGERGLESVAPQLSPAVVSHRIDRYRHATWHWQAVLGKHRSPSAASDRHDPSRAYRLWVLALWKQRAARLWTVARRPPHKSQWLCIHRYEGAWNDDGAPYYGGLQMDIGFQQAYGGYLLRKKGTAENWTPLEQMWVAERAFRTRGFGPWPNTAGACGLL